jgi:hypothetical protein
MHSAVGIPCLEAGGDVNADCPVQAKGYIKYTVSTFGSG